MATLRDILEWLDREPPPPEVRQRARLLLLDTLGCAAAGLRSPEVSALVHASVALEPGTVRWPGMREGLSASAAAFTGAIAACRDEACEGLARAHGRPGIATIAAAVPLALRRGATLDALLDALVAGYEVSGRLGEVMRIRPGMHVDATFSSFGAATAAAHLLGLGARGADAAVQIAASQLPASLYLPIREGADSRNTFLGHAALLGLQSAMSVQAGMRAPADAVGEAQRIVLGHASLPALAPVGEWLLPQGYIKPWAAVRHVHYGAAGALALRERLPDPAAVTSVHLSIYEEATIYCANRAPQTAIQAQFSLSWGIAAMLVLGDLGPEAFAAEALADARIRRIESLVTVSADAGLGASGKRSALLTVGAAGVAHEQRVERVPGDPGAAMPAGDVMAKFRRYATPTLGETAADALAAAITAGPGDALLAGMW
jgi:2-methylcitrate dehydratase PrpD